MTSAATKQQKKDNIVMARLVYSAAYCSNADV